MSKKKDDEPKIAFEYEDKPKHTITYHLKQMKKIAKTGDVPEAYEKHFKDIKNPKAHIHKIDKDIENADNDFHKEHLKNDEKVSQYCMVCQRNGKVKAQKPKRTPTPPKSDNREKVTKVEKKEETEPEIIMIEDGQAKKRSLEDLRAKKAQPESSSKKTQKSLEWLLSEKE